LVTALIAGAPSSAQTVQNNNKVTTTVNVTTNNALTFAINNVNKYYPDMKNHLDNMITKFRDQEHKDSTIKLLNIMTKNITDPKQKVGAIIYALE
jgi:hypothetical protein